MTGAKDASENVVYYTPDGLVYYNQDGTLWCETVFEGFEVDTHYDGQVWVWATGGHVRVR